VALLEGHLDPALLPLREEEEALFCCSSGDDGAASAGHYDVRILQTPVYLRSIL
jgi:hypothetical protein